MTSTGRDGSVPDHTNVVIVTGAAGNLGRATVGLLAERGFSIAAVDRAAGASQAFLDSLASPARHLAISDIDLGDPAACDGVLARTLDHFGRVDGLVHTVG